MRALLFFLALFTYSIVGYAEQFGADKVVFNVNFNEDLKQNYDGIYLAKHFHSNPKVVNFIKRDKSCLGYYGYTGAPGDPQYVGIYKDDKRGFYLNFWVFDAQKEVLSLAKKEFLPERIAQFLLSVLVEQIGQKKDYASFALDGTPLEFGIRKGDGSEFDCAGINSRGVGCVAMMRKIAFADSLEEINNIIKKYKSNSEQCHKRD